MPKQDMLFRETRYGRGDAVKTSVNVVAGYPWTFTLPTEPESKRKALKAVRALLCAGVVLGYTGEHGTAITIRKG